MKKRKLILALVFLLYAALVWAIAFALFSGPILWAVGFVLTVCGAAVAAVYWLVSRTTAAQAPPGPAAAESKPARVEAAAPEGLDALLRDANSHLANSPRLASERVRTTVSDLPLYLFLGAEGTGKTSTFLASGVNPELLAGEGERDGRVAPTPLCNFWFAGRALVADTSGRFFSEDPARWRGLLATLRGGKRTLFRALWSGGGERQNLRGAVLFCDAGLFKGMPDKARMAALVRNTQERLRLIGEVFESDFPVHVVFTKADSIPHFGDYFAHITEAEERQPLGCTLPLLSPADRPAGEVYTEAETRRIGQAFNDLYYSLADKRLRFLARETERAIKPGIYEFPRELKVRIRANIVDFLVNVFRPNPLQPSPLLRGFYFTGTRQVPDTKIAAMAETTVFGGGTASATVILSSEEARRQMERAAAEPEPEPERGRERLVSRWAFVAQLFAQQILSEASSAAAPRQYTDRKIRVYEQAAFGGVLAVVLILGALMLRSWWNNHQFLKQVDAAAAAVQPLPASPRQVSTQNILDLETLRRRLADLTDYEEHVPWRLGFRLYTGDRVLRSARELYFSRFRALLLNDVVQTLTASLSSVPPAESPSYPWGSVFDQLKAYLAITSQGCPPERPAFPDFLTQTWNRNHELGGAVKTVHTQFDFYARELQAKRVPFTIDPQRPTVDRARVYLNSFGGELRVYRTLLDDVGRSLPGTVRLADYAPNYAQVLNGPPEVPAVFSAEGWKLMQDRIAKVDPSALGDSCVLGSAAGSSAALPDAATLDAHLRSRYIQDYIARWREFLAGYHVLPYKTPEDAAGKLSVLVSNDSPLLALLFMASENTTFAADAAGALQQAAQKKAGEAASGVLGRLTSKLGRAASAVPQPKLPGFAPGETLTPGTITKTFQPVHAIFSPDATRQHFVGGPNNLKYVTALDDLRKSMQALGRTGAGTDPGANADAGKAVQNGLGTVQQMSYGFDRVPGVSDEVTRLLNEPFERAHGQYEADPAKAGAKKMNGELAALCKKLNPLLSLYPFNPASDRDVPAEQLAGVFAPQGGALWAFYQQNLAKFLVKQGHQWTLRTDAPQDVKIDPGFLHTFNRLALISDALFPDGAPMPQMHYRLTAAPNPKIKGVLLNGTAISGAAQQFTWPADQCRLEVQVSDVRVPRSYPGVWGIFAMLSDADREGANAFVLTKFRSGRRSEPEPIRDADGKPIPIRLEVQDFPNGVTSAFDRNFFTGLRCPGKVAD